MIICICHRVSDRDIARVARDGCASFDELQFELGVATQCGKCHDCAHDTFRTHAAEVAARIALPKSLQTSSAPSECPGRRALVAANAPAA